MGPISKWADNTDPFSRLVNVANPWVNLPCCKNYPVVSMSQSHRYAYGQDRALHFSYLPMCTNSSPKEFICFIHYVAVRRGSIASQSPLFANHTCTKDFYGAVGPRLRDALANGYARVGPNLQPLFFDEEELNASRQEL